MGQARRLGGTRRRARTVCFGRLQDRMEGKQSPSSFDRIDEGGPCQAVVAATVSISMRSMASLIDASIVGASEEESLARRAAAGS